MDRSGRLAGFARGSGHAVRSLGKQVTLTGNAMRTQLLKQKNAVLHRYCFIRHRMSEKGRRCGCADLRLKAPVIQALLAVAADIGNTAFVPIFPCGNDWVTQHHCVWTQQCGIRRAAA